MGGTEGERPAVQSRRPTHPSSRVGPQKKPLILRCPAWQFIVTFANLFSRPGESFSRESAFFLISAGIAGRPLSYDLHSRESAGCLMTVRTATGVEGA